MKIRLAPVASALLVAAASATIAQPAPVPLRGAVATVAGDVVTLEDKGAKTTIQMRPGWALIVREKTTLDKIKPGSFIGTTNVDVAGGGRATEVHIFPPGMKLGEGQRVMDAGGQTRMTNATVTSTTRMTNATVKTATRMTNAGVTGVAKTSGGAIIELAFPGGTRRVQITPQTELTEMRRLPKSAVKPGMSVMALAFKGADGKLQAGDLMAAPSAGR